MAGYDVKEGVAGLLLGQKSSLSRAITCIESHRKSDTSAAEALLEAILPYTGKAQRIGITGVPGVGKSTFIEALGMCILEEVPQAKIAVLAIDPSSHRSQGSIMADKTRMERLSRHPRVYIRPSSTGLSAGGMALGTQEAILLCEAAGYNYVFVETVGVGQTEMAARKVVDCVWLLMLAGAGDAWQGLKRGILEIADLLFVNKADGEHKIAAQQALLQYRSTTPLMPSYMPGWEVPVLAGSSLRGTGINEAWVQTQRFFKQAQKNNYLSQHRKDQRISQLQQYLSYYLHEALLSTRAYQKAKKALAEHSSSPRKLARGLIKTYLPSL